MAGLYAVGSKMGYKHASSLADGNRGGFGGTHVCQFRRRLGATNHLAGV